MKDMNLSVLDRFPDVEAEITLNERKKHPVVSGYRPGHKITENYITTGTHRYIDDTLFPGETKLGTITFISPEYYPKTLWIGKKIDIYEGEYIVGSAVITKIFNSTLLIEE